MTVTELIAALQAIPDPSQEVKIHDADTSWLLPISYVGEAHGAPNTYINPNDSEGRDLVLAGSYH